MVPSEHALTSVKYGSAAQWSRWKCVMMTQLTASQYRPAADRSLKSGNLRLRSGRSALPRNGEAVQHPKAAAGTQYRDVHHQGPKHAKHRLQTCRLIAD